MRQHLAQRCSRRRSPSARGCALCGSVRHRVASAAARRTRAHWSIRRTLLEVQLHILAALHSAKRSARRRSPGGGADMQHREPSSAAASAHGGSAGASAGAAHAASMARGTRTGAPASAQAVRRTLSSVWSVCLFTASPRGGQAAARGTAGAARRAAAPAPQRAAARASWHPPCGAPCPPARAPQRQGPATRAAQADAAAAATAPRSHAVHAGPA